MSNREKSGTGSANCRLKNPGIAWGKQPSGKIISNLFLDWKRGQLNPMIERAIRSQPAGLWEILEESSCKGCPHLRRGQRDHIARNPLYQSMAPYYFELVAQGGYRERRLLIILNLLRTGGSRPGGFLREDIEKVAGTVSSRSMTDRLIRRLCRFGLLSRKKRPNRRPRYHFTGVGNKRLVRAVRARKEFTEARWILDELRESMKKDPEANVLPVDVGMVIGKAPPGWFLDYMRLIQRLELLCWKNAEFIFKDRGILGENYSREDLEHEIEKVVSSLIAWSRSQGNQQRIEWDSYWACLAGGKAAAPIYLRNLFDLEILRWEWSLRGSEYLYAGPDVQSCSLDRESNFAIPSRGLVEK